MEAQTVVEEKPVNNDNKNRNIVIAVIAAVVLCCFCVVAIAVAFYAFTAINSVDTTPSGSDEEVAPQSDFGIGDPPKGGLGNDILRNDTWQVMAPAAMGLGCDRPIGANSTIDVLRQPDSSGYWVEKWTVVCRSGDEYAFEVEFITDDTGVTFNIRLMQ